MSEQFERALATGIKTEKDSIEMYRKAAANTANPLGKVLFETLVEEEQSHLMALEKHVGKENWQRPRDAFRDRVRTVFQEATRDMQERLKADPDDVEAIRIALEFERKGYKVFKADAEWIPDRESKELLEWLADQENEHFKLLQDLHEYLEKGYSWFVANEGPILDGGA